VTPSPANRVACRLGVLSVGDESSSTCEPEIDLPRHTESQRAPQHEDVSSIANIEAIGPPIFCVTDLGIVP
jgi:hypothetical protein